MKKYIGDVDICGLAFKVFRADENGDPNMKTAYGVCYPAALEIYIHTDIPRAYARVVLTHEMLHGIFGHTYAMDFKGSDREERMVSILAPHIRCAEASADRLRL